MAFQVGPFQLNFQQGVPGAGTPGMSIILAPDYVPGDAPRLIGPMTDGDLAAWARLAAVGNYLEDVDRWLLEVRAQGDEPVDVFADDFDDDSGLSGKKRSWGKL